MYILSIGGFNGLSNTCLHRNWALVQIADKVDEVNTRSNKISLWYRIANKLFQLGLPVPLPESKIVYNQVKGFINRNSYDIIWVDKGICISPKLLKYIKEKQPNSVLVSYSPDNMALRHNQSENFLRGIPFYDYHVTTKSYILNQLKQLGAQSIIFTNKSYESTFHFPRELTAIDFENLGGDVGFIGAFEEERAQSIIYLAQNGIKVRVFGDGEWLNLKNKYPNLLIEGKGLHGEDYSKSLQSFKISLCFLRKMNDDLQTSRTMEIPACGGFMLAERTSEHQELFQEDLEAVFFDSNEELLEKCNFYLAHEPIRKEIAKLGNMRVQTSGYSNFSTLTRIIKGIV